MWFYPEKWQLSKSESVLLANTEFKSDWMQEVTLGIESGKTSRMGECCVFVYLCERHLACVCVVSGRVYICLFVRICQCVRKGVCVCVYTCCATGVIMRTHNQKISTRIPEDILDIKVKREYINISVNVPEQKRNQRLVSE